MIDQVFHSLLDHQGELSLRVISSSMAPILRAGDDVVISPVLPEKIQRGDLITTRRDGEWYTHRLVSQRNGSLVTKGDRSRRLDPPVGFEQVLGVVKVMRRRRSDQAAAVEQVDLLSFKWKLLNRWLGALGWCEGMVGNRFFALPLRCLAWLSVVILDPQGVFR